MRVAVSPELSAFIAAKIANYAAEATELYHHWEAPEVAKFTALPLIRHWFETFGLRSNGEIVRWYTDGPEPYAGVQPVEERYNWLSALVEGARRWPELSPLLPAKPVTAVPCKCIGHEAFAPGKTSCPLCCGLRWVVVQDEAGAAHDRERK